MTAALAIVPEDGSLELSLSLPEGQSFDQWVATGRNLASASKVLNWWIGDWWAAGSHRYGARAQVAAQGIFGRELQSLMNYASVCRAFTTSRRREVLSFTHHAEVAALPPAKADQLLDRAEREGWSAKDLRAEVILIRDSVTPRWFEASKPTRYDREQVKEAIFDRLAQAASAGSVCPTADDLAEASGVKSLATTVAIMRILEDEKRIEVARFQKTRQVTIVATGEKTASPSNQAPHWRDRAKDTPAPTIQAVSARAPGIAEQIFAAAKRNGMAINEYLIDLVLKGWEVECAIADSRRRSDDEEDAAYG